MKKWIAMLAAILLLAGLAGCVGEAAGTGPASTARLEEPETPETSAPTAPGESLPQSEAPGYSISLQVGDRVFAGVLYDNPASRELVEWLPLTVEMSELNQNEKYCTLANSLPAEPEPVAAISSGDIMLYGDDCLVVFYRDFPTTYSYTRLGRIKDATGWAEALGDGGVTISILLDQNG